MSEKNITRTGDRLLEARRESLQQMNTTSMRPHGKLWGMDVFSWIHPNPSLVINTLHAFPFRVFWLGNATDIEAALMEDELLLGHVHAAVTYDSNVFKFRDEWLNKIENCAGTAKLSDSFHLLEMFKASQTILLFTASGENAEELKEEFENYLNLVRI
jgi:hypothetical protein